MEHEKYIEKKLRDIEGEIVVLSGVTSVSFHMHGKVTDGAIKARDEAIRNIQKIVHQIIKRVSK